MNYEEISRRLDEIYSNMTKEELQNKLEKAGFIVIKGPYGFIELENESFSLEPIAYSTTKRTSGNAKWELTLGSQGNVA